MVCNLGNLDIDQVKDFFKTSSINGTPLKINMEHNNGGLEDDFPFQIGDF